MSMTREQHDEESGAFFSRQDDVTERFGGAAQAERDRLREVAMDAADDVSESNPETRLFTVHISYLARRVTRGKSRSARWEADSARLVVQATSEADAVTRGTAWFEHERAMVTARIAFGTGIRDAIEVRLAESSKLGPAVRAIASADPHVLVIRI